MEIEWSDPPARGYANRHGGVMQRFIAELRQRPGSWAIYRRCSTHGMSGSHAKNLRKMDPHVEAVARYVDGEYRVYARWVGEPEEK